MFLSTPGSSYMIYLMINDVLQLIHVHLFPAMHLEIFREILNVLFIQFPEMIFLM